MKRNYKDYMKIIKYFPLVFIILYFMTLFLFLNREKYNRETELRELKNLERNMMITQSKVIAKEVGNITADLNFLEQSYNTKFQDKMEVENQWVLFCKNKHIYDKIRFIDKNGLEKIRIDYHYGSNESRRIDDFDLKDRSKSNYVIETLKLDRGKIFISQLDLNTENPQVEEPVKLIIRFSTPVYNRFEELEGLIVINYLAENILEEFKDISKFSNGLVYLLNEEGSFLYRDKGEEQLGLIDRDIQDDSFKNRHKDEWQMISEDKFEILSDTGLFLSHRINLEGIYKLDKKYLLKENIILSEDNWIVLSLIDRNGKFNGLFETNLNSRIKKIKGENIFYFINILFISILISFLISLLKNSYMRTKLLAQYDSMTQTFNRRTGLLKLEQDIQKINKDEGELSICFIDIDGLKEVNDLLGHSIGDELIITVVNTIKTIIRDSDYIIRVGGDEFIIIFQGIDEIQAEKVWQRINKRFEEINILEDRGYIISLSHGIVQVEKDKNKSVEVLITEADAKMYKEKKHIKKNLEIISKGKYNY